MKSTKTVSLLFVLLGSGLSSMLCSAAPNLQEGLWEIATEMQVPGMPMGMPPATVQHCFSRSDLADTKKILPINDGKCELLDYKEGASNATWRIQCGGEMPLTGAGEISYQATGYEGTMHIKVGGNDKAAGEMTQKFRAKRIGECK
ncbi:MAG TPA: DUF3617 family protein [Gammaproteobacteria bacterium]|nr:DUF3617 family protein [Gammaproteobacteria bacterium]